MPARKRSRSAPTTRPAPSLPVLAAELAEDLPGDWTVRPTGDDDARVLTPAHGIGFTVRALEPGRAVVTALSPAVPDGFPATAVAQVEPVTLATTAPRAKVAERVGAELLPAIRNASHRTARAVQEWRRETGTVERAVQNLAAVPGLTRVGDRAELAASLPGPNGEAASVRVNVGLASGGRLDRDRTGNRAVSVESVNLDARHLSAAQAERALRALNGSDCLSVAEAMARAAAREGQSIDPAELLRVLGLPGTAA